MMSATPDTQRVSRFIAADGVRLHALDWGGQGPPLLLVHGGRRTGRSWNAMARRLHAALRVLALDLRGHGDSEASVTGNDSRGRMQDMARVAEGLELAPHFVMAHSLGCFPAGLYASHYAERVRGLILIEPIPDIHVWWTRGQTSKSEWIKSRSSEHRNGWESLDDLRARLTQGSATRDWAPEVLDDLLREETRIFPDGRVAFKWDPSVYNPDEMWEDRTSLLEEAPRLTMPTLVVARSDNDQLESHLKPLVNTLPQGQLAVLPGLGHGMYLENPGLIADLARQFFASVAEEAVAH